MGDDRDQIHATIDLLDGAAAPLDGDTKLRVTIWSGPDFKTPTITRGGTFEELAAARYIADRTVKALELLGIPIVAGLPDGHEAAEPLLAPQVEGQEYPRLG